MNKSPPSKYTFVFIPIIQRAMSHSSCCNDYCKTDEITAPDQYLTSNASTDSTKSAEYQTTYHNIKIKSDSRHYTVLPSPSNAFQYTKLSLFGLRHVEQYCNRLVQTAPSLSVKQESIILCFDDATVHSTSLNQHTKRCA